MARVEQRLQKAGLMNQAWELGGRRKTHKER